MAFERVGADEPRHTADDVVEVHGATHFLAFAHHAANATDDFTRPTPVRDDGFKQAIEFREVGTPLAIKRRPALALFTMPVSGWFSSCASDPPRTLGCLNREIS